MQWYSSKTSVEVELNSIAEGDGCLGARETRTVDGQGISVRVWLDSAGMFWAGNWYGKEDACTRASDLSFKRVGRAKEYRSVEGRGREGGPFGEDPVQRPSASGF
jgi:hypothetical protein